MKAILLFLFIGFLSCFALEAKGSDRETTYYRNGNIKQIKISKDRLNILRIMNGHSKYITIIKHYNQLGDIISKEKHKTVSKSSSSETVSINI